MSGEPLYWRLVPVHEEPNDDAQTGFAFCAGTAMFVSTKEQGPVLSNDAVARIKLGFLLPNPAPGRQQFLLNMISEADRVLSDPKASAEERAETARTVLRTAVAWDKLGRKMGQRG